MATKALPASALDAYSAGVVLLPDERFRLAPYVMGSAATWPVPPERALAPCLTPHRHGDDAQGSNSDTEAVREIALPGGVGNPLS